MAFTNKLFAIGEAIRAKTGGTALLTLDQMPDEIAKISGGEGFPDDVFNLTGAVPYKFSNNNWNWYLGEYGNRIVTFDVTNLNSTFQYYSLSTTNIDTINVTNIENFDSTFGNCTNLTVVPKIRGTIKWRTSTTFEDILSNCQYLRNVDDMFTDEMLDGFSTLKVTSAYSAIKPVNFSSMYSLRQLPSWFRKFKVNPESTVFPNYSYCLYYYFCNACYSLDEITDIPVLYCAGGQTKNMFTNAFANCGRVKNITFEVQADGSPYVANWTNQDINLANSVGMESDFHITFYNSGITEDKKVTSLATYEALKDDPDWYASDMGYSRYNHDSAVATINTLPDVSSSGGTNTIQFRGVAGESYGKAISNLTEEEIAVATAKGWTVTIK